MGNYGLVSLEKGVEQILLEAISKHVKENKVTECSQHGYRKGISYLMNLIVFCDKMTLREAVYLESFWHCLP